MDEIADHRLKVLEDATREQRDMIIAIQADQSNSRDSAREDREWREAFSTQFHDFRVEQAASTKKQFMLLYVLILIIPAALAALHIGGH